MQIIDAANLDYRTLNEALRGAETDYIAKDCRGQRFIAAGMSDLRYFRKIAMGNIFCYRRKILVDILYQRLAGFLVEKLNNLILCHVLFQIPLLYRLRRKF